MTRTHKPVAALLLALSIAFIPHTAADAGRLAGSEWGFTGKDTPFVRFEADQKIAGHGGCNRFFGRYRPGSDGAIRIGPLAATKKHCGDAVMRAETAFLGALEAARRYQRKNHRLQMFDAVGSELLDLVHRDWD